MAPKRPQPERAWSAGSGIAAATGRGGFDAVPLADYLELDDRPTFAVALGRVGDAAKPAFANRALRSDAALHGAVRAGAAGGGEHAAFAAWVAAGPDDAPATEWRGRRWQRTVVAGRWAVVHSSGTTATGGGGGDDAPVVDWTLPHVACPGQHAQFLRDYGWAATALGAMAGWPRQLRSWLHAVASDPSPALLLWGPQLSTVYNGACVAVVGANHPRALGGPLGEALGSSAALLEPILRRVRRTGQAGEHRGLCLPLLRRRGGLRDEETYWTVTALPVVGDDGRVAGVCARLLETTAAVVAERRQKTLVALGELGGAARTLKQLWASFLRALASNPHTPFAAIYSVAAADDGADGSVSSLSAAPLIRTCELEGTFGLPDPAQLPRTLDLAESDHALAPAFRQAWKAGRAVVLRKDDGSLPACIHVRSSVRGHGGECAAAVVVPVRFATETSLVALLVQGLNPRRPYDDDYSAYMALLQARMTDLAANIHLPDEERRVQASMREEALRQASLASKLLSRTQEAELKQHRFMRLAEHAPIGMALYDADTRPIFFNDAYFDMTGQTKENFGPHSWSDAIHPDDLEAVQKEWRKLTRDGVPFTIQHRVRQPWRSTDPYDGSQIVGDKWLLWSAFPEFAGDDAAAPVQIMGWIIDISHQKWAEQLQRQRLQDALENKRQSENFIDMTSHEMRNPLSAILQSADGISAAVAAALEYEPGPAAREHLEAAAENAQTIVLCAQHQKRIVDDILTLSKLDSNLLLITPDRADPVAILRHLLKMYEAELASYRISVRLAIDPSYRELRIRIVLLDPSRLLQVLINLLTNAIKFTQQRDRRTITLSVAASLDRPPAGPGGAPFFAANPARASSNAAKSIQCFDDPVYLTFTVQDSGRGLSADERKLLFHRFSQANPRTHVQYGGSGLGLFISRELTELQGGQIGVASEPGKGSTFAFYVRACRCKPAPGDPPTAGDDDDADQPSLLPFAALPQRPAGPGTDGQAVGGRANTAPSGTPQVRPNPPRRRTSIREGAGLSVLVVEDNIINQSVMAKQLARIGCAVHVANHGGEALALLEQSSQVAQGAADGAGSRLAIDVALMDLEMPVMDGLTCVRRIRALERQRRLRGHLPIICTTANAREAQTDEATAAGCDLVITKPFRIPDLLPQMKRLVEASRQGAAARPAAK